MSESRRGNELAEMSAALRAHAAKANPTKDQQHARRALFQRIIQYLTIGIDMSPLFSDVIMNAHTKDMATKKMLYHYLTHYAQAKADLALLTVNTLQKDCRDEDPVVRGLAVRSMASMRVPDLVEYLVRSRLALARATKRRTGPAPHLSPRAATPPPPLGGKSDIARRARTGPKAVRRAPFFLLAKPVNPKTSLTFPSPIALSQIGAVQQGLQDAHPYPRKTAAMGVLKIYDLHPEAVRETELLQTLRRMLLEDQNAATVFNCVVTLMEIDGPKSLATKQIVYGLINRLKDFTEWAQVTILEIVALYPPADKTETFDVMNALEDRLQHSNSAVVLATVKCFLRATLELPEVHQQVFERMKAPLLTLAQTESQEPAYAVWAHLHLLTLRAPPLFANEYKSFFCRIGDPPAVKRLKIEALVAVADVGNTFEIVTELSEYVSDVEPGIAREAVRGIARVALEGDCDAAGPIVRRLLQFVHHGAGYVVAETLAAVARLTRKHRQFANECVAAISNMEIDDVDEPAGRVALAYLLGEFGESMPEAPYALEPALASFEEEPDARVRLELLAAAMKLFFKRPPEMRAMLEIALQAGCLDADQDVHDRAAAYVRLLARDPDAAARVVGGEKAPVHNFSDAAENEKYAPQIFDEFNTLSVLYREPAFVFCDENGAGGRVVPRAPSSSDLRGAAGDGAGAAGDMPGDSLIDFGSDDALSGGAAGTLARSLGEDANPLDAYEAPPSADGNGAFSFTNEISALAGLEGLGGDESASANADALAPAPLALARAPSMDPGTFQEKWGVLGVTPGCARSVTGSMSLGVGPGVASLTAAQPLVAHLAAHAFVTVASGGAPPAIKLFAHAADAESGCVFLLEAVVDTPARTASVVVKSDADAARAERCEAVVAAALRGFGT